MTSEEVGSIIVYARRQERGKDVTAATRVRKGGGVLGVKDEFYHANIVEYEPGQFRAEFYELPPGEYSVYIAGGNRGGNTADVFPGRTAYIDWR